MHSFSSDLTVVKPPLNQSHPSYNVGESVAAFPPLHLVYVHGFRGDHTSFQRFPTDLHIKLDERIPSLETHVFPTYKSRKPMQVAVERLMTWIDTLEAGFIILIGHSLGGFVVAEAAMQYVNRNSQIIGLVAMDVPYVGVHPHVIVSGIVSLFPSSKKDGLEQDLNDMDKVHMVSQSAIEGTNSPRSQSPSTSPPRSISPTPTSGRLSVSSTFSASSGRSSNFQLPDLTPGPTAWQNTLHFFKKHADDPLAAMKQWVVSYWEHGSILLDPSDLKERYHRLEQWHGGEWVNFYTETVPGAFGKGRPRSSEEARRSGDDGRDASHISFPEPEPTDGGLITPTLLAPSGPPSTYSGTPLAQPTDEIVIFPEPAPFSPLIPEPRERSESQNSTASTIPLTEERQQSEPSASPPLPMGGPLLLPHPPQDEKQQKEHDKAVKRIIKDQRADAKRATSLAEKAFKAKVKDDERETKAQAKLAKAEQQEREKAEKAKLVDNDPGTPHHFIITPWDAWPSKSNWQRVPVAGVPHEVEAHCGIFFREKNWEYDAFVGRVAEWIVKCCQRNEWGGKDVLAY